MFSTRVARDRAVRVRKFAQVTVRNFAEKKD
jgi:hypothetical protein